MWHSGQGLPWARSSQKWRHGTLGPHGAGATAWNVCLHPRFLLVASVYTSPQLLFSCIIRRSSCSSPYVQNVVVAICAVVLVRVAWAIFVINVHCISSGVRFVVCVKSLSALWHPCDRSILWRSSNVYCVASSYYSLRRRLLNIYHVASSPEL